MDQLSNLDSWRSASARTASRAAKRRDAALLGNIRPTTRPDADNYVKAGLDAINAIVIADDSLVVDLVVSKRYASIPQLVITITPLPAMTAQLRTSVRSGEPMFDETLAPVPQLKRT